MFIIITTLSLSGGLTALFILLSRVYKNYMDKIHERYKEEEKEKSLVELLDKYVVEEKRDVMKDKLDKISQIIAETEKEIEKTVEQKVKVAKDYSKAQAKIQAKGKEKEVITQAQEEYISFSSGLKSAMPETEEERLQDMAELKDAIAMLESFDEEHYRIGPKKVDAGVGMFYDRMSRRFRKILNEQKLNEFKFVPVPRLKHHAFLEIKNIKNSDILPILKIMKDTNLLKEIIEINSTLQVIVFAEEKIKLTNPEKVLLTFAYDEYSLTVSRLMELTEWKDAYAKRILNGLKKKGIITVLDDVISAEGFGHDDERKIWNEKIKAQKDQEKAKEEEKRKRKEERERTLKERLAKVEEAKIPVKAEAAPEKTREEIIDSLDDISAVDEEPPKIKFKKKVAVKTLPLTGKKAAKEPAKKVSAKEKQEIKDKDALLGAMDELDKELKFSEAEKKIDEAGKEEDLSALLDVDDIGGEEQDLQDLVPEKILQYHENFSLMNGGLVQYDLIRDYVREELKDKGEVPEDLIKNMLIQLKELQMIQDQQTIGGHEFYLFNKLMLSPLNKKFIEFAIDKKPIKKEDFMKGLDWPENRTLASMKYLQKKSILRIEEDGKIIFPGVVQKK